MNRISTSLFALLLLAGVWGCAGAERPATTDTPAPTVDATPPALTAEDAVKITDEGTEVTLYVTSDGFVPANVHVPAGRPVTLKVTRKTDTTCATELVMAAYDIDQELPLDQTVTITFTPEKAGELRYACGMDMIAGTITVD